MTRLGRWTVDEMPLSGTQVNRFGIIQVIFYCAHLLFIACKSVLLRALTGASTPNGFLNKTHQHQPLVETQDSGTFFDISPPRTNSNTRAFYSSLFKQLLTRRERRYPKLGLPCLPCLDPSPSWASNFCALAIRRRLSDPQCHLHALWIILSLLPL